MLFGLGKNKGKTGSAKASAHEAVGSNAVNISDGRQVKSVKRRAGSALASKMTGSVNKLFHGVAVRSRGSSCCAAVDALGAQRFLSEEAPLLPLSECSNPQRCRCVYVHFDERRDNLRRETDVGLPVRTYPQEKREGHGRRITDG